MQELVLNQPVSTARSELVREAAQADARREFEERLAECGQLAFRVARAVLRNTADAEDVAQPAHLPPPATVEDVAASKQFQGHLERALEELPEKLRLVLLLSAMEGHTIDEIASMVGVPLGTVKSRIFIARKKLAEKLRCYANTIRTR